MIKGRMQKTILLIYSILSLFLGIAIGLTIYYSFLPFIFDKSNLPFPYLMSVRVDEIVKQPFVYVDNVAYSIRSLTGNLVIKTRSIPANILLSLNIFLLWGSVVAGIFLIRKILRNIYSNRFFNQANIALTRLVGLMIIFIPFIRFVLQLIIVKMINDTPAVLVINGLRISKGFNFSFSTLLLGIFIYIFAHIFNEGFRLKQENDLTV